MWADIIESSDPYVTVAYARQGKPLFSTRIIQNDLNPVFEENTAVTVDADRCQIAHINTTDTAGHFTLLTVLTVVSRHLFVLRSFSVKVDVPLGPPCFSRGPSVGILHLPIKGNDIV